MEWGSSFVALHISLFVCRLNRKNEAVSRKSDIKYAAAGWDSSQYPLETIGWCYFSGVMRFAHMRHATRVWLVSDVARTRRAFRTAGPVDLAHVYFAPAQTPTPVRVEKTLDDGTEPLVSGQPMSF
jgi:hypothetical protein